MFFLNNKYYNNNISRNLLFRKYNYKNSNEFKGLERLILTIELKDIEDKNDIKIFNILEILRHISGVKPSCVTHSTRYKFGQKHTLVFQSILRGIKLDNFLTFFVLNILPFSFKKGINVKHSVSKNVLLLTFNDLTVFSKVPMTFFNSRIVLNLNFKFERDLKQEHLLDYADFLVPLRIFSNNDFIIRNKNITKLKHEILSYKR